MSPYSSRMYITASRSHETQHQHVLFYIYGNYFKLSRRQLSKKLAWLNTIVFQVKICTSLKVTELEVWRKRFPLIVNGWRRLYFERFLTHWRETTVYDCSYTDGSGKPVTAPTAARWCHAAADASCSSTVDK